MKKESLHWYDKLVCVAICFLLGDPGTTSNIVMILVSATVWLKILQNHLDRKKRSLEIVNQAPLLRNYDALQT